MIIALLILCHLNINYPKKTWFYKLMETKNVEYFPSYILEKSFPWHSISLYKYKSMLHVVFSVTKRKQCDFQYGIKKWRSLGETYLTSSNNGSSSQWMCIKLFQIEIDWRISGNFLCLLLFVWDNGNIVLWFI